MVNLNSDPAYVPITCDALIKQAEMQRDAEETQYTTLVTGVPFEEATYEDFQRLFKCNDIHKAECNDKGLQYPRLCSHPPCDQCTVNYISMNNHHYINILPY